MWGLLIPVYMQSASVDVWIGSPQMLTSR